MRVGVDGRSLVGGGARGVAHYTGALLEALAAEFPDDEYRVLLPRGRAAVPRGVVPVRHPLPARALFGAALSGRPRFDRLVGPVDVVWAPAPAPLAIGDAPFVLTVHDRSWEQRPGDFTPYERAWHAAARPRRLARRAARVLTDTEVGRDDLIRAWGLDAERVRAVPLAPRRFPPSVLAAAPRSSSSARSSRARRRTSWSTPSSAPGRAGCEAELVVVGEGRLDPRGPGVRRLGRVDDLGALYAGALAVVLPSWLEGFGLPPVEGLAAGAPAIVSDLPVFREVLGDGALYVPPGDAEALADALLSLERDPALRGRLLAAGQARIASLTWAETARRTRAVLAEAA